MTTTQSDPMPNNFSHLRVIPRILDMPPNAYARVGDNENFLRLVEAHLGIMNADSRLMRHYGWQLMNRGRMKEAARTAELLQATPADRDLNLEIAIAVEPGEAEVHRPPSLRRFLRPNAEAHHIPAHRYRFSSHRFLLMAEPRKIGRLAPGFL